jgi:tetratricopeptide (TPR) repeat protein
MTRTGKAAALALAAAFVFAPADTTPARAELRMSKDVGPASARCDQHPKETAAWLACAGEAQSGMPDQELFYAGYWLAKTGRYEEALKYLKQAAVKDEKILTYIGFATRKLGDVDGAIPFYMRALAADPGYNLARSYLGEAYLTKGDLAAAKGQLAEIASRCGTTCDGYGQLFQHIASFEAGQQG